jgi:PIN domain nuclease of toxin-antitoxin system
MTTVLIDTHIFLWLQTTPERVTSGLDLLEDQNTTVLLSAVSSWEIAVKWSIGKLPLPQSPDRYVPDVMQRKDIKPLPVLHSHALAVASLPSHHRDPFDRLLVAQAMTEGLPLMTGDPVMRAYDAELIWVG